MVYTHNNLAYLNGLSSQQSHLSHCFFFIGKNHTYLHLNQFSKLVYNILLHFWEYNKTDIKEWIHYKNVHNNNVLQFTHV